MILLDSSNKLLGETIHQRIELGAEGRDAQPPLDVTLTDFDGVSFHISNPDPNDKHVVNISVHWRCATDLLKNGADEILKSVYGDTLQSTPEASHEVTLQVNLNSPPADIAQRLTLLKRHLFAGPFKRVCEAVEAGKQVNPIHIQYREEESVFIKPEGDRVIVVFSVYFRDADDQIIARVFLQELAGCCKTISNSPAVSFSQKEPPAELRGLKGIKVDKYHGFVSFVLFKPHITGPNRDKSINNIQTFRNYLHYHIKCSKAYMHDRMRRRVDSLLQVLNRAKPEPIEPKERKTMAGKTFKPQPVVGKAAIPKGLHGAAQAAYAKSAKK